MPTTSTENVLVQVPAESVAEVDSPVVLLPEEARASQATVVAPGGKTVPDGGEQPIVVPAGRALAEYRTVAPSAPPASCAIGSGSSSRGGSSPQLTAFHVIVGVRILPPSALIPEPVRAAPALLPELGEEPESGEKETCPAAKVTVEPLANTFAVLLPMPTREAARSTDRVTVVSAQTSPKSGPSAPGRATRPEPRADTVSADAGTPPAGASAVRNAAVPAMRWGCRREPIDRSSLRGRPMMLRPVREVERPKGIVPGPGGRARGP